eukprot:GHRQ01029676.1.p3 GENE.GHRQ01029676.1~~GHRQ01029676.1.p3  ORF type:complete len:148 (+),score=57.64 GHRQ01029676.1:515-958(+)
MYCGVLPSLLLQDVQDFMQQLLGKIEDDFPQQALWAMATVCKSTVRARQEAASSILNQAKRRSGDTGRALFESFGRLSDQLIRTCMWQPPGDKRVSRCSALKEFKHLVGMLPVDVQVPVQVSMQRHVMVAACCGSALLAGRGWLRSR